MISYCMSVLTALQVFLFIFFNQTFVKCGINLDLFIFDFRNVCIPRYCSFEINSSSESLFLFKVYLIYGLTSMGILICSRNWLKMLRSRLRIVQNKYSILTNWMGKVIWFSPSPRRYLRKFILYATVENQNQQKTLEWVSSSVYLVEVLLVIVHNITLNCSVRSLQYVENSRKR